MQRLLTTSDEAAKVLATYEKDLASSGLVGPIVQHVAAMLFELVLIKLLNGEFRNPPDYLGKDAKIIGNSVYKFDENGVSGVYSSNARRVHLISISLDFLPAMGPANEMVELWKTA